jgi:hypothetical protein
MNKELTSIGHLVKGTRRTAPYVYKMHARRKSLLWGLVSMVTEVTRGLSGDHPAPPSNCYFEGGTFWAC